MEGDGLGSICSCLRESGFHPPLNKKEQHGCIVSLAIGRGVRGCSTLKKENSLGTAFCELSDVVTKNEKIGSLSKDVIEQCMSTGSIPFSFLGSGFDQIFDKIVSTRIKKLLIQIW